jgi:hypothetical protein
MSAFKRMATPTMSRFLSALLALAPLALFSLPAAADSLACGTYLDAESGTRLTILDGRNARLSREGMAPAAYWHRRDGGAVHLYNLDDGYIDDYRMSADGRTLTGEDATFRKTFVLQDAATCAQVPPATPGSCAAEMDACMAGMDLASGATLKRRCEEGVPYACGRWIASLRDAAKAPSTLDAGSPPVCREGTPTFDAAACDAVIVKALGEALAEVATAMSSDDAPLSSAQLDALPALCERQGSAKICGIVAEELWTGGRYAEARTALRAGCERGEDPAACRHAVALSSLDDGALQGIAATTLPCGRFVADTGLMSELDFGDRGRVEAIGGTLRARLQDGQIRIRHDKGGDFAFRRLGDDALLGLDDWNRYALYRREGAVRTCEAPTVYAEIALIEDCPQPGPETAVACCARGSLHGCNIAGNQAALANDWAGAKPHYLKVCVAGVRIGCENLAQTYAHAEDHAIPDALDALCAANARHVACDVRETTNWDMLELSRGLDAIMRELEREDPEGEDNAPQE